MKKKQMLVFADRIRLVDIYVLIVTRDLQGHLVYEPILFLILEKNHLFVQSHVVEENLVYRVIYVDI